MLHEQRRGAYIILVFQPKYYSPPIVCVQCVCAQLLYLVFIEAAHLRNKVIGLFSDTISKSSQMTQCRIIL